MQIPVESGGHGFAAGADDEDESLEFIGRDLGGGAGDQIFPHGGHGPGSEEIILETMDGEGEGKIPSGFQGHLRR